MARGKRGRDPPHGEDITSTPLLSFSPISTFSPLSIAPTTPHDDPIPLDSPLRPLKPKRKRKSVPAKKRTKFVATNLLKIPKGATRYGQGGHFVRPEEAEIILGDSKGTNQPVNKKIHPPPHPGSTMFVSPFPPLSIISTTTIYPPPYTAVEIGASPQDFQKSNVGAPMLSNEPFSSGRHRFGLDCGTSAHSTYSAVPSPLHHTGYSLVEPTSWYPHVQWDPSYWTSAIHYEHHPRLAPVLRSHPAKGDLAHVSPPTAPMPSGRWVFVPDYRQPQSAEGIEAQKTAGKLPRRDREDLARARRASAPLQDLISAKTTTSGNAKPVSPLTTPPSPKFHSQQSSEHHRSGDKRRSNGPEDGRVNRHVVPLVSRSRALVIQDEQSKCLSRDASRSYHQPQIERCVTTILTPPATPSSAGSLAQYNQPPLGDINDELRAIIDNLEKSTESETLGNTSPLTTDTISSPKALAALTEFAYDLINSIHPTTKTTITPVPMAAGSEGPSLEPIEGFPPSSAAVDSMVEMPMALNITLGVSVVEEEGGPGGAEAAIQRVHKDSTDITFNFDKLANDGIHASAACAGMTIVHDGEDCFFDTFDLDDQKIFASWTWNEIIGKETVQAVEGV